MTPSNRCDFVHPLLAASALALVLGCAQAQVSQSTTTGTEAQTTTYKPKVGQPGKDVIWVPTAESLVDQMLRMAAITPQDYLVDLGSGDGRTVVTAAQRGTRAHGITIPGGQSLSMLKAWETTRETSIAHTGRNAV